MLRTLLIAAAVSANAAFAGLAVVFDYPDVLDRPAVEVLDSFNANQPAVPLLFLLLAAAAALLAPIALGLARRAVNPRAARLIVALGIAAAVVQVIGLLRWPLIVPFLTDPAALSTLSTVLGTILGETAGYLLTAAFTLTVVRALPGPRPTISWLGTASAALIATGILVPLHIPGADLANFAGYLLWSAWLIALAVTARATPRVGRWIEPARSAVSRSGQGTGSGCP